MATYVCPPHILPVAPMSAPTMRSAQRALADLAKRAQRPAALRRLAQVAPDERPLVATCDSTDAAVVATNAAIHRLGPPECAGDWSRWGWEQIARIEWDDSTAAMTLIGQAPLLPDRVVLSLPGGGTVRVVVRRHPTTDRLDWFVYPDATVAGDGARGRAELDDALAALRADTGL